MKAKVLVLALHFQYNGNWEKIFNAIMKKSIPHKKYIAKAEKVKHNYISIVDENYPQLLKVFYRPPFIIKNTDVPAEGEKLIDDTIGHWKIYEK